MDSKLVLFLVVVLAVVAHQVLADIYFDRFPKPDELYKFNFSCIPGRTVIRVQEKEELIGKNDEDESDEDGRRSHMNFQTNEEYCQICVCNVEGSDEFCSKRPAKNVNECIRMNKILEDFNKNLPYEHERNLAYRIRRDYIWHKDEIPYESNAKCARATSYYTNDDSINDTTIDINSDIESLLDYSNKSICFYCVCTVDGRNVSCIPRSVWYCDYFRTIRKEDAARDRYAKLFQQDRPTYFRQLSFRLRRTMDRGMFDLLDTGGDTLCCEHPSGHRMSFHSNVINKIRQTLRKRVPKENLMAGSPGGDYVDFIVNNDK